MAQFLTSQSDLIDLIIACSLFLCGVECLVLHREQGPRRRWLSLLFFFVVLGLASLWDIAALLVPAADTLIIGPLIRAIAWCSLYAMADGRLSRRLGWRRMAALSALPLAISVGVGIGIGWTAMALTGAALIGLPGLYLAARFLPAVPEMKVPGRPWLAAVTAVLVLFGILSLAGRMGLLRSRPAVDVLHAAEMLSAMALAVTLTVHEWRTFLRLDRGVGRPLTRFATRAGLAALPIVLAFGLLVTRTLGERAAADLVDRYTADVNSIQGTIAGQTGELDRDALIVSRTPPLSDLLARPDDLSRDATLSVLESFAREVNGRCFVLDRNGSIVASSAGMPLRARGTTFAGRTWFRDAIGGGSGRDFQDSVDGSPSYFATSPIWRVPEGIIGVVVIERQISSFFPRTGDGVTAFLVSPLGTVVWASDPRLAGRMLWPSGPGTGVTPILPERSPSGTVIPWDGGSVAVTRAFLSVPGWSVEELGSMAGAVPFRAAGLFVTLALALVIVAFVASGRITLIDEIKVDRSESLYRALVEGSPNWVSMVDSTGIFHFTNAAGRKSLGIDNPAEASVPVESVIGQENVEEMARKVRQALATGTLTFETFLPTASGDVRIWHIAVIPRGGEESTDGSAVLIANDITQARRAEARLIRAEKLAALGGLAAGVAHQFNNIDSILLWNLELLQGTAGLPPDAGRYLVSMREALNRSVDITSRLMPLTASPDAGRGSVVVALVVRDVLARLRPDLERDSVQVELDLGDDRPVAISGAHLEFVVNALLVNAWHAVKDRPVRRITARTSVAESSLLLRVEDSGPGIEPGKISRVFTPFFSEKGEHAVPGSPFANLRGVGLSLSVSYAVVTAAGGRMDVESPPGQGAVFSLWLPLGAPAS